MDDVPIGFEWLYEFQKEMAELRAKEIKEDMNFILGIKNGSNINRNRTE